MLGYDFEIIYKKGKENIVTNTLSRKDENDESLLCALSILQANWVEEAKAEWQNDVATSNLIQQVKSDPSSSDKFFLKGDILWYKEWLYLCKNSTLKHKILKELHESPIGGYSTFLKIYHQVKQDFFWEGLNVDVQKFVVECLVCQRNKEETIKTPSLL